MLGAWYLQDKGVCRGFMSLTISNFRFFYSLNDIITL